MTIAMKYIVFAGLATLINLASQESSMALYQGSYALVIAMVAGTLTGLVSKYLLDKHFIFYHKTDRAAQDLSQFLFYGLTGVFTTVIFWGFELGFDFLYGTRGARYTGAVIGLAIGYLIKYRLDKRYVFVAGES
ncbi:MAG: GtrA family protein [Gammaproteobacteria bacterium]|nr:polysaccharide biosynthesis protein GtrA [Gammaproteobacteria bacterium]MDP6094935.1 GtrA family protein [Gammaproteobacteria bacterium]HJO12831.1 GtrA family protein [Gammaproteobacteria bacterium]